MINRITQKEIAKHMNVSISTVSKALKDSYEISEDLRHKIQAYAKQNKYFPNPIALNLKNKSSQTIALILPEIVHHFFSSVIKGIEEIVNEKNYNLIISLTQDSLEKEIQNVEHLAQKNIDGFILCLSKETQWNNSFAHIQEAIDIGLPVVLFDRVSDAIECDKVISNDYESAIQVTNKLLEEGRKKIGLITTQDFISVGTLRRKGYEDALKNASIEIEKSRILKVSNVDNSDEEIKAFIGKCDADAIIGVNETFTAQALMHLKNIGKNIPDDVSLVAFSDGILSTFTSPKLTALDQQGMQIGKASAQLLIDRLEAKAKKRQAPEYKTEIIETKWIKRDSTKKQF
jgi:LacI family transcriptional regulator